MFTYVTARAIQREPGATYTPEQVDVEKIHNATFITPYRAILHDAGLADTCRAIVVLVPRTRIYPRISEEDITR